MRRSKDDVSGSVALCAGPLIGSHGSNRAISCDTCEFSHLDPIPSEKDQVALYEHFWSEEVRGVVPVVDRDLPWRRRSYKKLFAKVEKILGDGPYSFMDIGCGLGDLLAYVSCREEWYDCIGVDPDPDARVAAQRYGMVYERIPDWRVHCIAMLQVLEHVADPAQLLREVHESLRPGGVLLLSVPHDFSFLQRLFRTRHGDWWIHRHHINYFNWGSLELLLDKTGYKVEYRTTTFPMELFLFLTDYTRQATAGRWFHQLRKGLEWMGLDRIYPWLIRFGLGRHCVVLARKAHDPT